MDGGNQPRGLPVVEERTDRVDPTLRQRWWTTRCAYEPALTRGYLTEAALRGTTDEWRAEILAGVRAPRLGQPEDIAGVVAFLFSDDAAYINGQSILVDGGANFT